MARGTAVLVSREAAAQPRAALRIRWGRLFTIWLPVAGFLAFTLLPIYWLVVSSLKGPGELFAFPIAYWPDNPTFENYTRALTETRLGQLYLNSLFAAGGTCLVLIALMVVGGYAMARFDFTGRSLVLMLFLAAQLLPPVVMLVPVFTMFAALGLLNTRGALVVIYVIMLLPFSVMTMRSFYAAIPEQLEEAAMIDGCTRLGALFRVVLPVALPGLVATTIYGFINSWNELLFAVMLVSSPNLQTIPVGLMSMTDEARTEYGMMLAIAVLALAPSLILFGSIQRWLTAGLSAGAVKG
ncbi:carbohydrate ABC transporter permease [Falsiroseomonas tokyonensis]|uniref:Carbohydrate ABC transporter permease n=1 Tax=Falsiroseomonas tokyonensis TaxID=430521 RepID=A0ABV7BWU6_9PROT|nr:carbohydrate ABC transporter permease [Falsiroseomonas tokyonensis]MBU8538876.1 carbohydrate ABC transporter permease [Falsiroseomonas tokyonensis]